MPYKILIVDDEPANLRLLSRLFRRDYLVISAESGQEALELLKQHNIALIISDQRMPGMTGIEFLKQAAEMRQHTVRIILTGYTDVGALIESINSGIVYKYVNKPWVNEDLQQTVTRALEHYETIKSQYDLKQRSHRLSEHLKATQQGFVQFIAEILNSKDQYAYGHALRTKGHATAVGHHFNLKAEEIEMLSLAAYLREIGNLGIPDNILQKEEPLTEEEQLIVDGLNELGARMLEGIPGMEEIASVIRYQHEHFDGSGSPENLRGLQIPFYARILSVVSAYDLMTNPRSFPESLTHEEALKQLRLNAGSKFDPNVVAAFCELESGGKISPPLAEAAIEQEIANRSVPLEANNLAG